MVTARAAAAPECADRVYKNEGNSPVLALVDSSSKRVLDVGCGAGDNARLLKIGCRDRQVFGITYSEGERELASHYVDDCWIFDVERDFPAELASLRFDTILFSHVLEHLRSPAAVVERFAELLTPNGAVVIAVPNVLTLHQRLRFLSGSFEYETAGILDDTHLRFFTYKTASKYLLSNAKNLVLEYEGVTGSVPLYWLRRYILPTAWSHSADVWGCKRWPNLFGAQVLMKARKHV